MTIAAFKAAFSRETEGTSLEELFLRETIQAVLLHPDAGWGLRFLSWIRGIVEENGIALSNLHEKSGIRYRPNDSAGNGSAMRVSPIPYLSSSLEECKALTRRITGVTHDHPDRYRAAECVATSIYLALEAKTREEIRKNILSYYPEVEGMTYEALNREYRYTELARDTVPPGDCLLPREQGLRGRPLDGRLHRRGRGHPRGDYGRARGSFLRMDGRGGDFSLEPHLWQQGQILRRADGTSCLPGTRKREVPGKVPGSSPSGSSLATGIENGGRFSLGFPRKAFLFA